MEQPADYRERESTGVARRPELRAGRVGCALSIEEVGDSANYYRFHIVGSAGCSKETSTFHLYCERITVLIT
jgi:hypothetical protein